jgi:type IV fimbrial biogenesis protein FimT
MSEVKLLQKKKNQNGFSLIELVIVLLVIAILVTLAIPSIQRTLQLYRLETGTSYILHRLTEARLAAIKRNRDTWLEINATNGSLNVKSTNDSGQQITLGYPTKIPEGVQFSTAPPSSVIFSSLGRNRANANTQIKLKLAATNQIKTINIGVTGNITITN